MKTGDRITVHSGRAYTDEATVETICHVDELPAIEGAPNVESVRAIIAEGGFVAVALISYKFLEQDVCFVAFQDARGRWSDLKGQQLIIEPRSAENELDRLLKKQQSKEPGTRIVSRAGDRRRSRIDWSKF